ncbi:MAG: hypothetical protein JSR73_19355 [Proteobacteria bacterium]|nr:hypothetical protein [Pseudomonadota bacterium]
MEVTSYGERPRDLLALLVPFLAAKHYTWRRPPASSEIPEGSAAFEHPDGDFVVTAGRFNCIVVAYYALSPGKDRWGVVARDRAGSFEVALMDFLEGLPTPRPVPREVVFGSKYCVGAT